MLGIELEVRNYKGWKKHEASNLHFGLRISIATVCLFPEGQSRCYRDSLFLS